MKNRSEPGKGAAAVGASPVTVEVIPIIALAREQAFQVRKKLDEGTVKRYVGVYTSGKSMPPVKVAKVNGVPILVDGWHRVAALERMGTAEVEAEVSTMTRRSKQFPFESMEVGDSFLTDIASKSIIYYHMKRHSPKRFLSRTVREPSGFGLRVWRVL